MALQSYHFAWLGAHQDRTQEWLEERLKDGFHIHHLDGNHDNDDPGNLVLIEGGDHFRLHGGRIKFVPKKKRPAWIGEKAYDLRMSGLGWKSIREQVKCGSAYSAAKRYAEDNGLPWVFPKIITKRRRKKRPTLSPWLRDGPGSVQAWIDEIERAD